MGLSKERVREMANYLEHRIKNKFPLLPEEIREEIRELIKTNHFYKKQI